MGPAVVGSVVYLGTWCLAIGPLSLRIQINTLRASELSTQWLLQPPSPLLLRQPASLAHVPSRLVPASPALPHPCVRPRALPSATRSRAAAHPMPPPRTPSRTSKMALPSSATPWPTWSRTLCSCSSCTSPSRASARASPPFSTA